LANETLKPALIAQETERRLTDILEAFRRQTEPIASALQAINNRTAMRQLITDMDRKQEIIRAALGPMEELRRRGFFEFESPLRQQLEQMRQVTGDYEARFRLPEVSEATRLIQEMQNSSVTTWLKSHQETATKLRQAIEAMKSPWLDTQNALRSFSGFAELQGIGQALRSLPTFDDRLASALRQELGDWRQAIKWPAGIFIDPIARTAFYIERGLNPHLTNFPAPAFQESMSLAGLQEDAVSGVEEYSLSETENEDERQGFARTNAAHDRLQRFETHVRRFIDRQMTAAFGTDWIKHQLPGSMLIAWREKKQKAVDSGEKEWPLLAYADFTDYVPIIMRKDNWEKVFKPIFQRREFVQESFQRLYPIRICTMHARIITQDDELYLHVEIKRILRAIKSDDTP
jgi:Swt1-like HEPN